MSDHNTTLTTETQEEIAAYCHEQIDERVDNLCDWIKTNGTIEHIKGWIRDYQGKVDQMLLVIKSIEKARAKGEHGTTDDLMYLLDLNSLEHATQEGFVAAWEMLEQTESMGGVDPEMCGYSDEIK